jgi:integrase
VQDKQPTKSPQSSSVKTYGDLEAAYSAHLKSENKSEQDIKNFRSNLKTWRQFFNAEIDTAINLHFGKNFSVNLEKFKAKQLKDKAKESTVASKASNLKRINEFLTAKSTLENLSPKFGERLLELIRNAGFSTIDDFWRFYLKGKCDPRTIKKWCAGVMYPGQNWVWLIIELEKLLNVPAGTLLSLLRSTLNKKKVVHKENASRAKNRLINSYKYKVWEESLEEEFQGLLKFKTERVLPEGIERHIKGDWTTSEGRGVSSAKYTMDNLQSFFGYLHLSEKASDRMFRGMSYSKDKLTLGLLADKHLVESYVTGFKKWRSFDKYNNGHINFLGLCTSLLRPKTGYLYQNPGFALKIGLSGNVKEWQKKCVNTRNRLLKIQQVIKQAKKSGSKDDFQMGRDPREPIVDILALPNPISVVMDMLSIMLSDVEAYTHGNKKAIFFRDILLIAMLVGNPLRISMFSIMKFDRNLIRKEDGRWWIHFIREDFKNRKSIQSDYAVLVAPELIPLIERYKREFRPLLFGAEESDYVFLKGVDSSRKKLPLQKKDSLIYKPERAVRDIYSFAPTVLSGRIIVRVMEYLDLPQGFRAHAFRHIVATNIIKSTPETGFFLASKVLHDKLETVEDNYSHLKTHEFFEPYNRFISGFFSKIIDTDGNGISADKNGGGGK